MSAPRRTFPESGDSPVPLPLAWAQALIRRADGPVPDYGSPEWAALDDRDGRKVAACVVAAEAWRTHCLLVEHNVEVALAAEEPALFSRELVQTVHRIGRRPSYAELCERRGEPDRADRARQHERRLNLALIEGVGRG